MHKISILTETNLVYLKYPHYKNQISFFMRAMKYIPKSIKIETLSTLIKSLFLIGFFLVISIVKFLKLVSHNLFNYCRHSSVRLLSTIFQKTTKIKAN